MHAADSSLHGEATGLLHGGQQLLVELLVRFVRRDVYPVETGNVKLMNDQCGRAAKLPTPLIGMARVPKVCKINNISLDAAFLTLQQNK